MQNEWVGCNLQPPADVILNGRPRSGRERRIQLNMCRVATLHINIPNLQMKQPAAYMTLKMGPSTAESLRDACLTGSFATARFAVIRSG